MSEDIMTASSDDHVTDLLLEYLADSLDSEKHTRVTAHLETCDDCAADYSMAGASGVARHVDQERMAQLSVEGVLPSASERAHLERCSRCRHTLSKLQELGPVDSLGRPVSSAPVSTRNAARIRAPRRSSFFMLVPLSIAAAALVVFLKSSMLQSEVSSLASLTAMPVELPAETPADESFDAARMHALEAYRDGDWDAAQAAIAVALIRQPGDGEMRLYLGSAYLLDDESLAALAPLRLAANDEGNPRTLRNDALWLLANAYLQNDDGVGAQAVLAELGLFEKPLREVAQRLLAKL